MKSRLRTALALAHPFLFAAGLVLDRWVLTPSSLVELPRPMLVALLLAGLLVVVWWALTRHRAWAGLLASTSLLILAFQPIAALVMVGLVTWWILVAFVRRARGLTAPVLHPTSLPVVAAVAYAGLLFVVAAAGTIEAIQSKLDSELALPAVGSDGPRENIYLVILDGYPRSDTLNDAFGMDNSVFEHALADLGFVVAPAARSNYTKTWLSLGSLYSGQYLHDLPELDSPPTVIAAQARLGEELINAAAALDEFRARGYEVVSIPSPVPSTDVTTDATLRWTGHLTSFEIALVTASLPSRMFSGAILSVLAADARAYADAQLELLIEEAASQEGPPRIIIGHLMPPHPPFVLGQSPSYLDECFPVCKVWETTVAETGMSEAEFAERMRIQVTALNQRMLDTARAIVEADPDAMVIIASDHGARHHADDENEHFRTFFAARSGGSDVRFPADVSLVNVFRTMLSGSGTGLADLPYEATPSDWYLPLTLKDQ